MRMRTRTRTRMMTKMKMKMMRAYSDVEVEVLLAVSHFEEGTEGGNAIGVLEELDEGARVVVGVGRDGLDG